MTLINHDSQSAKYFTGSLPEGYSNDEFIDATQTPSKRNSGIWKYQYISFDCFARIDFNKTRFWLSHFCTFDNSFNLNDAGMLLSMSLMKHVLLFLAQV